MTIEDRKDDHIDICLNNEVRVSHNHWNDVHLVHQAIPACDLEDIDLSTKFLGRSLSAPLLISAMTGGSKKAEKYNRILAKAAEEFNIGFGVGSQRAGLERSDLEGSYSLVKEFNIPLTLGNLGAPQLSRKPGKKSPEFGIKDVQRAIDMIGADAICIHLNYLQEVIQPKGDTNVEGFMENLMDISKQFKVIIKETGAGISREIALQVKEAGVSAIDIGGASGTSFSAVESYRSKNGEKRSARIGRTYWDWGIPSPVSLRLANVGIPMIATGGLTSGLDLVKALSLGADLGGMAWPLLKPASISYDALKMEIEMVIEEIRVGIFLSGASSVKDMSSKQIISETYKKHL